MRRYRHRFSLWFRTLRVKTDRRRRIKPLRTGRPFQLRGMTAKKNVRPLRGVLLLAIILLVVTIGLFYINNHLRPIMTQMASANVDRLASRVINEAISKRITGVSYGNLIYFEKDIYGQITALKTDIIAINRLKADITDEVLSALEHMDTSGISIPLGNLINSDVLSGRGPKIPLKIVPLGTVTASFSNQFTAAGINQTRHQIMMDITVDISVLLPGYSIGTQVGTQVSIAETVIVGSVPETYFQGADSPVPSVPIS